jgi:hypothetical protein
MNPVSYAFAIHALTTNFGLAKPSTKPSESAWVKSLAGTSNVARAKHVSTYA